MSGVASDGSKPTIIEMNITHHTTLIWVESQGARALTRAPFGCGSKWSKWIKMEKSQYQGTKALTQGM
jgi:hypothetical protein